MLTIIAKQIQSLPTEIQMGERLSNEDIGTQTWLK